MTSIQELNISDEPKDFICPITTTLMEDPVITQDGFTYERKAIEKWFTLKKTSPMTNEPIDSTILIPNRLIKSQIIEFREKSKSSIINDLKKNELSDFLKSIKEIKRKNYKMKLLS
jgi:hypothetical protein